MAKTKEGRKGGTSPPRRKPKAIPEYMRLRGSVYYGQVRLQTGTWKHVRLSKDLTVAKRKLRELQAEADLGLLDERGKSKDESISLIALVDEFATANEGSSPEYLSALARDARLVFEMLRSPTVSEITIQSLVAIRTKLAVDDNDRKRSNRTRNRIIDSALRVIRWAVECGRLPAVAVPKLKKLPNRPEDQVRRKHALTLDEASKLVTAAKKLDRDAPDLVPQSPMFELLLGTGFRLSESTRLQWCDFTTDNDSGEGFLRVRQSKNGFPRTNPISEELRTALVELRKAQTRVIGRIPGAEDYILVMADGTPWALKPHWSVIAGRVFHRVRKKAELPNRYPDGEVLCWHALRHSFCCFMREQGIDLGTTSVLMGHRTLSMTQRIYSRYERIQKKEVLAALPSLDAQSVSHSCQADRKLS